MKLKYQDREQAAQNFMILDSDLVLDAGCGPNSKSASLSYFQRADILIDANVKLIEIYRNSGLKFVVASLEALPFKNEVFDFVWCAHVLEHVEYPKIACTELSRIGLRGRILTPSKFKEIIQPNEDHLWMVSVFDNRIIFERKYNFLFSIDWKNSVKNEKMDTWIKSNWRQFSGELFLEIFDWSSGLDCIEIRSTSGYLTDKILR